MEEIKCTAHELFEIGVVYCQKRGFFSAVETITSTLRYYTAPYQSLALCNKPWSSENGDSYACCIVVMVSRMCLTIGLCWWSVSLHSSLVRANLPDSYSTLHYAFGHSMNPGEFLKMLRIHDEAIWCHILNLSH